MYVHVFDHQCGNVLVAQSVASDCCYLAVGVSEHIDDDLDRGCDDHGCDRDDHDCDRDDHGCDRDDHGCVRDDLGCDRDDHGCGCDGRGCVRHGCGCDAHGSGCDYHYDRGGDGHSSEGHDHGYESDDHDVHDDDGHDCSNRDRVPDARGFHVDVDRICVRVECRVATDLCNAFAYLDSGYVLYKWTEVLEPDIPRHIF